MSSSLDTKAIVLRLREQSAEYRNYSPLIAAMRSQPPTTSSPPAGSSFPEYEDRDSSVGTDGKQRIKQIAPITNLATAETERMDAVLGSYILRLLRIQKGPRKDIYDLDAVCNGSRRMYKQVAY